MSLAQGTSCSPLVQLLDEDPARRDRAAAALRACGVAVTTGHEEPGSAVAAMVVAVPEDDADGDALAAIRRAKAARTGVVAYGSGAAAWPLAVQCRVLVAGAAALVDAGDPAFAAALRVRLAPLLREAAERGAEERRLRAMLEGLGMAGRSAALLDVMRWIARVAPVSDVAALVTGETGVGKELVARALHRLDPRRCGGPFVAVNCGAISEQLAESELFGHRRGAFTGADRDRKGLVRAADGGVLFLDEVGELTDALQAKLLRVLQEGRVLAVGEDREVPVSVRVVAATHRDLPAMVRAGRFRADLYHRLAALAVVVPPLRERPDDVAALVEHFLARHAALAAGTPGGVTGVPIGLPTASPGFVRALAMLPLPGNARELENLVRHALLARPSAGPLELADLPRTLLECLGSHAPVAEGTMGAPSPVAAHATPAAGWNLARALDRCERELVRGALRASGGNQTRAARLLGITVRSVYNKLQKHRLDAAGPSAPRPSA